MRMQSPGSQHWLPGVERRGLGDLLTGVNHIALIVADVGRSATFYTDVLGLQQIQRPNFDRHGAWMTAGNVEIHLIKGTPLVHTGENLIVSHIALDVRDPALAFQRLREMRIPFEINVSVPKGEGKAESEGGDRGNTLSQAFLRDPDGYYIEICNCDVLTDFALGRSSGLVDTTTTETALTEHTMHPDAPRGNMFFYCLVRLVISGARARKRCKQHRKSPETLAPPQYHHCEGEDSNCDAAMILDNFCCRREVYGDICQSFSEEELAEILMASHNYAPLAISTMIYRIQCGETKRIYRPPAYYVEAGSTAGVKFCPSPIEAARRRSTRLHIMTSGLREVGFQEAENRRASIHAPPYHAEAHQ